MSNSLLTRVHIQAFQSVSDTTLNLKGLNVLVGPGDAGKSAILRALRAAFLNEAVDDDIQHGAKKTEVALTFEDGTTIEWEKEKGKGGTYKAFGKEFTKTGGAVPDEIAQYLGIGRIEVDATTELTPQLSDQHDTPFIIFESGSKRARILGKATRLDVVVTAQMACKKQLDTHRREAERAVRELEEVVGQLASLPDVEALSARLDEIEETHSLVKDAYVLVDRVERLRDRLAEVRSQVQAVDVDKLRSTLQQTGHLLDSAALLSNIAQADEKLGQLRQDWDEAQGQCDVAQKDYEYACQEAGVCSRCGGLLSHEECTQ